MKHVLTIALLIISFSLMSQVADPATPEVPKTLRGSFDQMVSTSNNYQEFKVVKRTKLNAFIREVQDSINIVQKDLNAEIKNTRGLRSEVKTLNDTIANKENQILQLSADRDNINTVGMSMNKESFSTAMWVALMALLGLLIVLFFRSKSVSSTLRSTKGSLGEMEAELATVKKKALEREQELKREVQNYVNKIEAMGPPR